MKKAIENFNSFRNDFRARHDVSDEIRTSISFNNDEFQSSIIILYLIKYIIKNNFG